MQTDTEFFWDRVLPEPNSGCWLWTGRATVLGYGQLRTQYAHRFSYALHKQDPGSLNVCHRCDVPSCVNPDHLFLGTQKDNIQDMFAKGRNDFDRKGEKAPGALLSERQVLDIRQDNRSLRALARAYGVHHATIYSIKSRQSWKHI